MLLYTHFIINMYRFYPTDSTELMNDDFTYLHRSLNEKEEQNMPVYNMKES